MAANYVLLEKITVGAAGASSVTFSGIPQTGYTDLVVKASVRDNRSGVGSNAIIGFNGSTSNFTFMRLIGDGATAESDTAFGLGVVNGNTSTASTFSNLEVFIPNYTSANNKSYSVDSVSENNGTTAYAQLTAGVWSQTTAISSVNLYPSSGNSWMQYSTFYLYGVAKLGTTPAIVPYATGGDTIMTDGTYWYHAFKSSGTFTPAKGLSCDVLVVAGGGAGGAAMGYNEACGGGGAGGVYYATAQSFASGTGYTATIGAGGAGGTSYAGGSSGSNSSFAALTTAVGGGLGKPDGGGDAGGSGGGGGAYDVGRSGGAGTSGQGNNGGNGFSAGVGQATTRAGGGGGGRGAVGTNATSGVAGAGGIGTNSYSSWLSSTGLGVSGYIAGGGGGTTYNQSAASGGTGGGGAGVPTTTASNGGDGTANTGGGGGGAGYSGYRAGNGGSGLVIVRYLV
jgi:hypothetical protein